MPCIPGLDPSCNPLKDALVGGVTQIFDTISKIMVETAGWAVKTLVTGWIMAPSPIMDSQDVVDNLRRYTYWIMTAVAVAALLVAATRMVLEGSGKAGVDAAAGLGKLVLVTSLSVPITIALTEFGDGYSRWIITESVGVGLDQRVALFAPTAAIPGITQFATIGITGFLVLVSVLQMLISIAVGGLKVLLCGLAPLPAAASISGGGKAALARYLTWLAAALLYKPVAATIYAGAFWMTGTGQSFETVLTGIVVITGAIFAMPALLRLLAPVAAQVAGPSGASIGGSAAGGAGTIASGAVRLQGARSTGGGGGGSGQPARSGPAGSSGGGAPAPRPAAAIGPGQGGSGAGSAGPRPSGPAGGSGAGAGGGGPAAGGGGTAAGGGAAAGGGGAAAGGAAGGGAAAAAGPAGIAIAAGVAAAKVGPAAVRKVGGIASGAAEAGEQ